MRLCANELHGLLMHYFWVFMENKKAKKHKHIANPLKNCQFAFYSSLALQREERKNIF